MAGGILVFGEAEVEGNIPRLPASPFRKLVLRITLKFLRDADAIRLSLEPILRRVFAKRVEVQHQIPGHIGQTDLSADRVDLIFDAVCVPAGIFRRLPTVIARQSDFQQ